MPHARHKNQFAPNRFPIMMTLDSIITSRGSHGTVSNVQPEIRLLISSNPAMVARDGNG